MTTFPLQQTAMVNEFSYPVGIVFEHSQIGTVLQQLASQLAVEHKAETKKAETKKTEASPPACPLPPISCILQFAWTIIHSQVEKYQE